MYNVDRATIESWIKERGLPMIEVTSHSKFITKKNLERWESSMMKNKTEL